MRIIRFGNRINRSSGFEDLLNDIFSDFEPEYQSKRNDKYEDANIYHKDGEINYEIALPGVEKENLKLSIDNGEFLVKANREGIGDDEATYLNKTLGPSYLEKKFPLPVSDIDKDDLHAKLENGILYITVSVPEKNEEEGVFEVQID